MLIILSFAKQSLFFHYLFKSVKKCMLKDPSNPFDFFWAHLNNDFRMIGKSLNMNLDEVFIILDCIVNSVMNSNQASPIHGWKNKNDRQAWENTFRDAFLRDTLKESLKIINKYTTNENNSAEIYLKAYELVPIASNS